METPMPQPIQPETSSASPHSVIAHNMVGAIALILIILATITIAMQYQPSPGKSIAHAQAAAAALATDPFVSTAILARSAIVVDLTDRKTLYSKNPDAQLPLASLAKIPLALVVAQAMPLDTVVTIPRDTAPRGSVERLARGEKWRIQDIIDFTLVASSNGGAEILSEIAEGPIRARYPDAPEGSATLWRMNQLAGELRLSHTYFINPTGLDQSTTLSGAYGTVRDIATLFAFAASSYPTVFNSTAQDGIHLNSVNGGRTVAYNTNEALSDIPGLIMGKTGITDLAGGNLAVVFDVAPNHPVVAIVLGSTREGRFDDMRVLVGRTQKALLNN